MTAEYTCPVCERKILRDMVVYLQHVKEEIVQKIQEKNPNWTSEQGICPKCKGHYESWFDQVH